MSSTPIDNNRQQLISKLKEMFQMDQADLDFGIYRIMNVKRNEVSQFLEQASAPCSKTSLPTPTLRASSGLPLHTSEQKSSARRTEPPTR